jgi:hypothetical protein
LPRNISVSNECFSITRESVLSDKNTISIKSSFNKKCTEISEKDYPAFRELILDVIRNHNEYLVLTKE